DLTAAGQYRAALRVLHRIVTLSPDAPEAEVALLQAGQIYLEKLSQPAEARRIFRAFCQRYPYSEWRSQAVFWEHQAAAQMAESRR
ncbi:MAG TPA: tetratricopeptide repeat protein, partial [Armatimonadetes bacterium]|nr:tetratricopeptide repeat protein [Armatimonadota bacterium]